jgi:UDP-3-O-[3-hydroxymyristoyl] N-acetylglucosamine deacetylase
MKDLLQKQKTVKNRIICSGIGLHSGKKVNMVINPAGVNQGIVFKRNDIKDKSPFIKALYNNVTETNLGTTISNQEGVSVATIEHLMSALACFGIDNAIIEVDVPEIPVMDGSSAPFVFLIECAGVKTLDAPRNYIKVLKEISYQDGDKTVSLKPSEEFKCSFEIDFANAVVGIQKKTMTINEDIYKDEIAKARTFGFVHEVEYLRQNGLAMGGSLENAIVIDGDKILNKSGLRYSDEFVRHKILDAIGDLYLAASPILGAYDSKKGGHGLNNVILHKLFTDTTNYKMVHVQVPTKVHSHVELEPLAIAV